MIKNNIIKKVLAKNLRDASVFAKIRILRRVTMKFGALVLFSFIIVRPIFGAAADEKYFVGPIDKSSVEFSLADYEGKIRDFFENNSVAEMTLPNYKLTMPKTFRLFGATGYLVCAAIEENQKLFSYSGPYALMMTKEAIYLAGGNYLCDMTELSKEKNYEYRLVKQVTPIMTKSMFDSGVKGRLIIEFTVNKRGKTKDITVLHNSTENQEFKDAGVSAVKKFRYKPRRIGGKAHSVTGVRQSFKF